jgi:ribosomal protein S18 acetylase RimI-like enzyme
MTQGDLAGRIRAFERELERRCAARTEPTTFGTAYLNQEFPIRYDSNYLRVERTLDGVDADALAADADRVLGELGIEHRRIYAGDDVQGRRLAAGFRELGWTAERLLVMAQTREPESRPEVDVRETDFDGARRLIEEAFRRRVDVPAGEAGDEVTDQVTGFRRVLERVAGARFFVADADGRPASVCERYAIGSVAQVESVNTLEEFRGRGLGSAVVLAAARSARERGCDLVFLVADHADWPKNLYARLGFDPVARFWSFLLEPNSI